MQKVDSYRLNAEALSYKTHAKFTWEANIVITYLGVFLEPVGVMIRYECEVRGGMG